MLVLFELIDLLDAIFLSEVLWTDCHFRPEENVKN